MVALCSGGGIMKINPGVWLAGPLGGSLALSGVGRKAWQPHLPLSSQQLVGKQDQERPCPGRPRAWQMSLVKVQQDSVTTGVLNVFSALRGTNIAELLGMWGANIVFLKNSFEDSKGMFLLMVETLGKPLGKIIDIVSWDLVLLLLTEAPWISVLSDLLVALLWRLHVSVTWSQWGEFKYALDPGRFGSVDRESPVD